jgi:PD-(D/E)XK endonuclease
MLTTDQKGAIAEAAIAYHALRLGVPVFRPLAECGRYDLIFDLRGQLRRVQCKWASQDGDALMIHCCSHRRNRDGIVRRWYSADEIDAFAAYSFDLDACYFLPIEIFGGRTSIRLRVAPARNNQKLGVNWAADWTFAARLTPNPGAVAQLGERCAGSA